MRGTHTSTVDLRGASLMLAGAMCFIPFLQPRHMPPIRTFYDEWLAFSFGLTAMGLIALARRNTAAQMPALSFWLGLFALTLVARGLGGNAAYPQLPFLWALYALFAAFLVLLGHDLAMQSGRERVCDTLAAFVLFGALANSIAGVLQVVGIPPAIDSFISYLNGKRAFGNIGQPNLYANYLTLGVASLVYLFARGKIGITMAIAAALFLLPAAALSASRSYLLYLGYLVLLGRIALLRYEVAFGRRICISTIALAIAGALLQSLVPAVLDAAGFTIERVASPDDWTSGVDASTGLRLIVWQLAWQLFVAAPWLGVGPGEFSGAGFALGLPIELASDLIWTSPHNVALQLLAEAGLVGAVPIAIGLLYWANGSTRETWRGQSPAMWWVMACVGVEIMHSMLEFPLWYAHFLAITALLMGIGAGTGIRIRPYVTKILLASGVLGGILILAVTARDYARFDLAIPASAGLSLAPESRAIDDRAILRDLRNGLLAPRVELMLFLALPFEGAGLAEKIAIGERVLRVWPSSEVVGRQSVFLALAGRDEAAVALLARGLNASKVQRKKIAAVIVASPPAARSVLRPTLERTQTRPPG